jgi:T5SS/PEP-CTERM-associated repeat protein
MWELRRERVQGRGESVRRNVRGVGQQQRRRQVRGIHGALLQTGGALIISNSFAVGNAAGAFGVVTNTGGSFWLNNTLNVGNSGAGAFGRAYFSGPSNYVKSAINVGNAAADRGELIVAGGQLVSDGAVTVGNAAGSTGMVSVTGGTALFKGLTVGQAGQGALLVSGGVLAVTNGGRCWSATPPARWRPSRSPGARTCS